MNVSGAPRTAAAVALALAVALAAATADARTGKLVGADDTLYAIRDNAVLAFDARGNRVGRCMPSAGAPSRTRGHRAAVMADADEALRASGLPDDDHDTPEAEAVLDDEGLLASRARRARGADEPPVMIRDVAADEQGGGAWIATSAGLFRFEGTRCRPAGLAGRNLLFVAARAGVLAAASAELVWRSETEAATFAITGLTMRPRALAITNLGGVLVADDDGVLAVAGDRTTSRILERPTDAVATCGDAALALASDGVYAWRDGDAAPARAADRPAVGALACGRSADARWIATGSDVWTSPDGTSWTQRTIGESANAAAATADGIWIAQDDVLVPLDRVQQPERSPRRGQPTDGTIGARALHDPGAVLWPRIGLLLAAEQSARKSAWSVSVVVAVPLGRVSQPGVGASEIAAARLRRDAALAAEATSLAQAPANDAIDADERTERLRTVRAEQAALP